MSLITIINISIGVWWGILNVVMTYHILGGGYFYEPNPILARVEFATAIIGTGWFLWQIPYWWIKLRRRKREVELGTV